MKKKKLVPLILIIIFILALFLRLYKIDLLSTYSDETGHYLLLHLILERGSSIMFTLYNKIYYGTFTYTWLFGLNPLGVRFGSALYGSLALIVVYLFAKEVSKNKIVALISALLMTVLPWSYMISRIGHTHIPLIVIFVLLHTYFFLRSNKVKDYLISLIPLWLTTLYYPSMFVIAPIISLFVISFIAKTKPNNFHRTMVILLTIIAVLFIYGIKRYAIFNTQGRALDLAIWRDVNTPYEIDKYRALSWNSSPTVFSFGLPPEQLANKLVYNRVVANIAVFTRNYLSFFSPDWLFLKGDAILRHSTGQVGAFYPFLIPFMLYGAFKFFSTADKKARLTFLIWILVSPIPAAITKDGAGYLLRAVTLLPFLTYFCALGIVESFNLVKKNWRWPYGILVALIGIYSAYYFFYGYFHVYPALSARSYEYGFKELSDFQVAHDDATMLVVWDGYYHNGDFRFWQKTPFDQFEAYERRQHVYGESTFWQTFSNLYFAFPKNVTDFQDFLKENPVAYIVLPDRYFVKFPEEIKELLNPIEEIKYPDQSTAFQIFTPRVDKKALSH